MIDNRVLYRASLFMKNGQKHIVEIDDNNIINAHKMLNDRLSDEIIVFATKAPSGFLVFMREQLAYYAIDNDTRSGQAMYSLKLVENEPQYVRMIRDEPSHWSALMKKKVSQETTSGELTSATTE